MHDKDSPLHVPWLHQWADPGAIFDPNGNFIIALLPVINHSVVNSCYLTEFCTMTLDDMAKLITYRTCR